MTSHNRPAESASPTGSVSDKWATVPPLATGWDRIIKNPRSFAVYNALAFRASPTGMARRMSRVADTPSEAKVLDIATGGGPLYRFLDPARPLDYTAIDYSPLMLERARQFAAERGIDWIAFEQGDAQALRYDDASIDVVWCYNGLHCMPDPKGAIHEMLRVLKPGGKLYATWIVRGQDVMADAWISLMTKRDIFGDILPQSAVSEFLNSLDARRVHSERDGSWLFIDIVK